MSRAAPALCVGLATRDRCALAVRALEAVLPQLGDCDELIVVDSGSSDDTHRAVTALLAGRPRARVLSDPAGGVSRARNLILEHARESVVCFFDDDELVEPNWVESLRAAWARAGERVGAVGGPIRPAWQGARPPWLADELLYVLSILDLGPTPHRLGQVPRTGYIWGGNMSVSRSAALQAGGFDEEIGIRPSAPLDNGEEEDLQRRLAAWGYETWWEPTAVVHHELPPSRTTPRYFRRAFRAAARKRARSGHPKPVAALRLARSLLRLALAVARLRGDEVARASLSVSHAWTLMATPSSSAGVRWRR